MGMQIPREIYDCWKQVADKFKFLHQGTDDERREATKRGVATIRARFRGQTGQLDGTKWVAKTQHNTGWGAQSKDALAFVEEGPVVHMRNARMSMFDMINGSSRETNPYPVNAHNHEETPPNDSAYILIPEDFDWIDDDSVPPPVDTTHKYNGGGNDTGICDTCGKDRHDLVHKIPAASQKHTYDGGEQDTGLCDVCQQSKADAIHDMSAPLPPTDPTLQLRVAKLERQVELLESRVQHLEEAPSGGMTVEQVNQMIKAALAPLGVSVGSTWGHAHSGTITGKQ